MMSETLWAVAGAIVVGGLALWLLRNGLERIFRGGWDSGLGAILLGTGVYLALSLVSGQLFDTGASGNDTGISESSRTAGIARQELKGAGKAPAGNVLDAVGHAKHAIQDDPAKQTQS
jgi:hypothetical protein